jgi:hypothetical protein
MGDMLMSMYRFLLPGLLVTLCILGLTLPVSAASIGRLALEPEGTSITVSNTFDVKVWIRDLTVPMMRFTFAIGWDPTLIEYVEHENFVGALGWTVETEQISPSGSLMYYNLVAHGDSYSEDAIWAVITFHCLGEGSTTIKAEGFIWDQPGLKIPLDPAASIVNQLPNPVGGVVMSTNKLEIVAPFAALAGLVIAVSAVVVVKKRRD